VWVAFSRRNGDSVDAGSNREAVVSPGHQMAAKQHATSRPSLTASKAARWAVRAMLEANGYWARHRSVLPYGIDYQWDIKRLACTMGFSIGTFFDVGAHTGETSSAALANFPQAEVFAFEPHPPTFLALQQNITATSPRFQAFPLALSNKAGRAPFFKYGTLATSNSMVEDSQYAMRAKHPATKTTADCETLDGFCQARGVAQIDVLKVDAEGHDLAVLQGGEGLLAGGRVKFVFVEFNSMLPREGTTGGALLPIGSLLEPLGFQFVASYPEYMITEGELFVTSNALFVLAHRDRT
jgi:FkbM family methyltransferase